MRASFISLHRYERIAAARNEDNNGVDVSIEDEDGGHMHMFTMYDDGVVSVCGNTDRDVVVAERESD